jgi:hypothetical protein
LHQPRETESVSGLYEVPDAFLPPKHDRKLIKNELPVQQRQGIHRGWPSTFSITTLTIIIAAHNGSTSSTGTWAILKFACFRYSYILILLDRIFYQIDFSQLPFTPLITYTRPSARESPPSPLSRRGTKYSMYSVHSRLSPLACQAVHSGGPCRSPILNLRNGEPPPRFPCHLFSLSLSFLTSMDISSRVTMIESDRQFPKYLQSRSCGAQRHASLVPLAWKTMTVHRYILSTYQALPWLVPVALGILPRLFREVCDQFVIHVLYSRL